MDKVLVTNVTLTANLQTLSTSSTICARPTSSKTEIQCWRVTMWMLVDSFFLRVIIHLVHARTPKHYRSAKTRAQQTYSASPLHTVHLRANAAWRKSVQAKVNQQRLLSGRLTTSHVTVLLEQTASWAKWDSLFHTISIGRIATGVYFVCSGAFLECLLRDLTLSFI